MISIQRKVLVTTLYPMILIHTHILIQKNIVYPIIFIVMLYLSSHIQIFIKSLIYFCVDTSITSSQNSKTRRKYFFLKSFCHQLNKTTIIVLLKEIELVVLQEFQSLIVMMYSNYCIKKTVHQEKARVLFVSNTKTNVNGESSTSVQNLEK